MLPYEPLAKRIIHAYKYQRIKSVHRTLGPRFASFCLAHADSLGMIHAAIPIPLHPDKQRTRGFNQAELIASYLPYPLLTRALKRTKLAAPNARTKRRSERFALLKSAFRVDDPVTISGKRILLVDDVATTGATLSEAARTLRSAGAQSVSAAVLAHG